MSSAEGEDREGGTPGARLRKQSDEFQRLTLKEFRERRAVEKYNDALMYDVKTGRKLVG